MKEQKIISFGFKNGRPAIYTAGVSGPIRIIDCRRLVNPYHDPSLRLLNGKDERVQKAVIKCLKAQSLMRNAELYYTKYHLSIAFGCHGGNHRSVAMAEMLAKRVGCSTIIHRDLKEKGVE